MRVTNAQQWLRVAAAVVVLVAAGTVRPEPSAEARPIANWSYERLMDGADVVAIASLKAVRDADDPPPPGPLAAYKPRARVATFEVKLRLKGKPEPAVELLHFVLPDHTMTINGPRLLSLGKGDGEASRPRADGPVDGPVNQVKVMPAEPDYLLFLKRAGDGRYEPLSGEFDPVDSVRELREAGR